MRTVAGINLYRSVHIISAPHVESAEHMNAVAAVLAELRARILRGGAFKRSSSSRRAA